MLEVIIIPKSSKDKKNSKDLTSPPDYQEKLQRSSKKIFLLKEDLKQNLAKELQRDTSQGLKLSLKGLDEAVVHIEEIFGDKSWIDEIDKTIEKELATIEIKIPEMREKTQEVTHIALKEKALDQAGIKSILSSVKKTGVNARDEQSFDEAIQILQDVEKKLLPAIESHLPEKDIRAIKTSLLKELQTTLMRKGKINEAIQVIDSCCVEEEDSKTYIEAQIEKSFLLAQKAEFTQAVNLLKDTLKYENSLPDTERTLEQSAEIKRALAIAYRGQGFYQKALKWFKEAQKEFHYVKDEIGYYNALWGIGILRHLTGEWDKAIQIWKKLIMLFEKQPDTESITKRTGKPPSLMLIKVYTEYAHSLQLYGKFEEAETILDKALTLAQELKHEHAGWYHSYLYLLYSDLYYHQEDFKKASQALAEVRRLNTQLASQGKEKVNEMKILRYEINVLLASDKAEEAKRKLLVQFDNCKSNWEKAAYYRLLGLIEKHEMNFGLAKEAFKSSLEITKEIGASSLSDELLYIELLIEMSKTGNQKAINEVEFLLTELETEVKKKKISAFILECNLLRGHLARVQSNYDQAYQLYSEIIKDADTYRLYRQKHKALEGISLIEQEGQQLRTTRAKELSVYRYLEDARRILEENS
ncbi:MAG: tetratricopeptide repeat protein [Candidatus Hodarchaeota archaeon]